MNVYTKEQSDEIATYTAQQIKAQRAFITNQRTGQAMQWWSGTQAQYDAIVTKDDNTMYWIMP